MPEGTLRIPLDTPLPGLPGSPEQEAFLAERMEQHRQSSAAQREALPGVKLGTMSSSTGWARYERHFALWAEENGYDMHFATNR